MKFWWARRWVQPKKEEEEEEDEEEAAEESGKREGWMSERDVVAIAVCVWLWECKKVYDKIPKRKRRRRRGGLRFRSCLFAGITVRKRDGNGYGRMEKVLAFYG